MSPSPAGRQPMWRFAGPVGLAWITLAITVSIAREAEVTDQTRIAWTLIGIAAVISVTSMALRRVVSWLAWSAIYGLVLLGFAITLLSRLPVTREDFRLDPDFGVSWAGALRQRLLEAARDLPGPGNQLVPGLAVGDTGLVESALDADMKSVSLTHLVAVSGANCAVITAGVIAVVSVLGGGRWMRSLAAMFALAIFVIIVGPQPSVIRASVMACILLVSLGAGNSARGVPILAIATTCLLLVNPLWAIDVGFTLSVLATGALLVLARPLARALSSWMPHWLAVVVSVPLAAEIVCQPVVVILNPGLPTYGVVANILATPAAPLATVAGLMAAIILPVSAPVGTALLWLCWIPAQWIAGVATLCADLPFARLLWPDGVAGVASALVLSGAVILAITMKKLRRRAFTIIALALVVSLVATVVTHTWRRIGMPRDWLIAACNVGQGDAILIRPKPESTRVMLIDTGRDEVLLRACLDTLGVSRIAVLVLTHYDIDHVGAYASVLGHVETAIVGAPVDLSETAVVDDLRREGATVIFGHSGLHGDLGVSGFTWREMWPAVGHPDMQSGNPGSLVIRAEWPHFSGIFLGDLGEDAQRALLSSTAVKPATVVKVAHHGSADQSAALYARLHARIGLVSVGANNGYGHPTDRALSMLNSMSTEIARTDTQGLILVSAGASPADGLEVWSER